jgi:uncharacterized RDD family membrane protein YckC
LPNASLPRRLAAALYELLLLTALVFIAGFVLLPLISPSHVGDPLAVPSLPARTALFCALFAIVAVYCVFGWTGGRRTLPQKTWHLRLIDAGGSSLDYRRAFVRYLAGWIGPAVALVVFVALRPYRLGGVAVVPLALSYLAALVDPERLFLHDRVAGTRLVDDRGRA